MRALRREHRWRAGRDVPFIVLCVAAALGMVPAVRQPSATITVAGSELDLVVSDAVFLVLGLLIAVRLLGRGRLPRPARSVTYAAAAFSAWLLASSLLNGADAVVGAARLLEYGVLALGAVLFVQRRAQLWILVGLVVALTWVAVLWSVEDFATNLARVPSFLGPHDFAALSTMALAVGLAALYAPGPRRRALAAAGIAAGAAGVVFGAALASLLGLYLAVAATIALAARRGAVTRRAVAVSAAVVVVVTGSVVALRLGDLGATETAADGGVPAGSYKQRLLYAYIGGRVFLDNPVVGTGWYGELPPREYARYLPDARDRFPELPPHYFPAEDGTFLPQQTYDQILFELGVVGALLFALLAVAATRTALAVGRAWPRAPDAELAYVPAAWLASLAGALAGAAFFGGGPLTAIFWLTLGAVAVAPSLVPPVPAQPPAAAERREPVAAGR